MEDLEAILDAVPGLTLVARDPACRVINGSRTTYELLRLPYGTNLSKSAPARERPSNFRIYSGGRKLPVGELPVRKAAVTGRAVRGAEITVVFNDGSSRHFYGNAAPVYGLNRELCGAVGVFVDVTERKHAEESSRLFRMFIDQSNDAIEVVDPESLRYLEVNGTACQNLGFSRKELLSMSVYDVVPTLDATKASRINRELQRCGYAIFESLHRRKDGSTFPVEVSVKRVQLDRTYNVVVARDITERKWAEQALQESQAEVARVARIGLMGELTASIAHEINQPLGAVVVDAAAALRWLAQKQPGLKEARKAITRVLNEANRASDVIARVRALLQKAPVQMLPLDANDVVREGLKLTEHEQQKSGVKVETEFSSRLPTVLGDRVQLQQVMVNLIMNAIEAMVRVVTGPRKLTVSTKQHSGGVLILVQDVGKGIDPAAKSRLFEPFFTTKPGGIGMGLAVAHSIIEAHGGRLWADDGNPVGAVFQFTLPVNRGPDERNS